MLGFRVTFFDTPTQLSLTLLSLDADRPDHFQVGQAHRDFSHAAHLEGAHFPLLMVRLNYSSIAGVPLPDLVKGQTLRGTSATASMATSTQAQMNSCGLECGAKTP